LIDRYKMARANGERVYEAAVQEDRRLLRELGATLLSVDNGPRIVVEKWMRGDRVNPWDVIQVNAKLWGWLRPLLVELIELRGATKKNGRSLSVPKNGKVRPKGTEGSIQLG